ncbi:MAG TPA: aminotransferase class I/II-fold pyridoxal phosphate-dependent enzyme [Acidobacteriota bacterium]|nr:aminotransferase class I/II-fold pyridoxal phosphate-dependent enzyme [Acidobacteriota bacterium]
MVVRLEEIGRAVRETEYAVRGPIVARARELELAGREVIYCNIGNPQALGQRPLTWIRQVLALVEYPALADRGEICSFPSDVIETARLIARESHHGLGAYTESKGMRFVRRAVADFIEERDGITADPEAIYLTDGASKGVQTILRILISGERDGVMIPIPQYPLYSATITLLGGRQVPYYLNEESGWMLTRALLENSYQTARANGINVRGLCVINPGNPTGAVLDEKNLEMVIDFAQERELSLLADEVYQENIYHPGHEFHSFAKILERMKAGVVSLFSFHSCSKGLLGECGHRGGYFECRNVPRNVLGEITKLQSVALCANSVGQVLTYLMVHPPKPGTPSYELYAKERGSILDSLRLRASLLADGLNGITGISCQRIAGAMYAFPKITLPPGCTDSEYCLRLLEQTGICVVPGTGFGQESGTFHFRTTILPPKDKIEYIVKQIANFHMHLLNGGD